MTAESKRVMFVPDGGQPITGTLIELPPLGTWGGGNVPFPDNPIEGVPGRPGYVPPDTGIWPNPPEGVAPIPGHPIVLPGDPSWGPPPDIGPQPPDAPKGCVWGYSSDGWVLVCGPYPGGKPKPPGKK